MQEFQYMMGLSLEIWNLLREMAPYLLFGFFMAGLLHVLLPRTKVYQHFSRGDLTAVFKASMFGIPLPICSCGVIPVAAHIRKEGANRGPLLSFLISTPTTGVDSILATYSLLGVLFAVVRPLASLFSGLFAGSLANTLYKEENRSSLPALTCHICTRTAAHSHPFSEKVWKMFRYSFLELVEDIGKWIVIGILVGGVIAYLIPAHLIETYLGNPFLAYPLMLAIGVPMYVCATGSIPIAASLILKGMTPGAGLIFLFAGPATNTATLSFVGGKLGRKSLVIYLSAIIFGSLIFGGLVDLIWNYSGKDMGFITGGLWFLPEWIKTGSALILSTLMMRAFLSRKRQEIPEGGRVFEVPDMSCEDCLRVLDSALRKVTGVKSVHISLQTRQVKVWGAVEPLKIVATIRNAGFSVKEDNLSD